MKLATTGFAMYKPLTSNKLIYPTKEAHPQRLNHIDYIELFNTSGCHYDYIMACDDSYLQYMTGPF